MEADTDRRLFRLAFIDDEPWVLLGMQNIIPWEDYGFERAYAFGNAEEALQALRADPVDAVLTDIRLPEMSGLDLTACLLGESLTRVVVIVSAYRDFEYAKRAISEGVLYYLLKPLDQAEVRLVAGIMQATLRRKLETAPRRLDISEATLSAQGSRALRDAATFSNCYLLLDAPAQTDADVHLTPIHAGGHPRAALLSCKRPLSSEAFEPGVSRCHPDFQGLQRMLREAQASKTLCFSYCHHATVSDIQFYIATHFADRLLNSELARVFYMSEVYMSECFKRYTGMTAGAFVIHVRMREAMRLLSETDLSVREIGERIGYVDAGYFGRLFRKKVGVSPERYRHGV